MSLESELRGRLRAEGLAPSNWSNAPHDRYAAHRHDYDKVIAVSAGSIRFGLPDTGQAIELQRGDRLELPAGTTHDAVVGGSGVACLEAHLAAGTFAGARRRAAGTW
jgi:quercetin dioxygenase-like cupin family protein